MQKPIPADEVFQDMVFPMHGLDLSCEYDQQPPGTTPVGINVRANEPGELRQRGGQRPGLSKYIADQIPEGAVVIQHLNVIVDPTTEALLDSFDATDDAVFDPSDGGRNPGRWIRRGGWGRQPNRNRSAPRTYPGAFALTVDILANHLSALDSFTNFASPYVKTLNLSDGVNNYSVQLTATRVGTAVTVTAVASGVSGSFPSTQSGGFTIPGAFLCSFGTFAPAITTLDLSFTINIA